MKHKLLSAAAAILLAACPLTGCDDSESGETIAQDDLPYGATVVQDMERDITICYDKRFLPEGLVNRIYAYYHAIQTKNAEEFSSALFPLYHEYQLAEIYGGELSDQALLDATYDTIAEYFGYDFEFTLVDVTDAFTEDYISADRDSFLPMLDDLAAEQGEPSVIEHTKEFYQLTVTRYIAEAGSGIRRETDDMMENETLFAIQYDDEWYLLYP